MVRCVDVLEAAELRTIFHNMSKLARKTAAYKTAHTGVGGRERDPAKKPNDPPRVSPSKFAFRNENSHDQRRSTGDWTEEPMKKLKNVQYGKWLLDLTAQKRCHLPEERMRKSLGVAERREASFGRTGLQYLRRTCQHNTATP